MRALRPLMIATCLMLMACNDNGGTGHGRVMDRAEILSPADEAEFDRTLAALERRTGVQMGIATTKSLEGKPIAAYAHDMANHWGLGSKARNDGLLLLIAPRERQLRIAVGVGLEKQLTKAECARIIDRVMIPLLRRGEMAGAIRAGTAALSARLDGVSPGRKAA